MTEHHPLFGSIQSHLSDTITYIDAELEHADPPIAYAGDKHAQRQIKPMNLRRIQDLKDGRQKVYAARVDWEDAREGPETLYIGNVAIPERQIYSWASPLCEDLYYRPAEQKRGVVRVVLQIDLAGDKVNALYNQYVHPDLQTHLTRAEFTDSLLFQLLQQSRDKLRDIVATIQEQQYRLIRSPKDQMLIIQGAPGSGKTSIALHRVAYLLYHHREHGLTPRDMLVLGPNRMFLDHIATILPALGERQVPHKTFDSWIEELLGDTLHYESQEEALEAFFDPSLSSAIQAMRYRNARNKGSLRMATMLDRYVQRLAGDVLQQQTRPLQYTLRVPARAGAAPTTVTVSRSIDDLRILLDMQRAMPLNKRRDAVEAALVRDMLGELRDLLARQAGSGALGANLLSDEQQKKLGDSLQKTVHQYFADWHTLNVSVAYRRLLRTPDLLRACGTGLFSDDDLELLLQDAPTARIPFRFSDLAALMYLKLLLDGSDRGFQHIIVDEAQDMTPLHFHVLQRYNRGASLTILGDPDQGIYPHHGLDSWDDLMTAIDVATLAPERLRESYRSTHAIITFANALLRRTGVPDDHHARPIARPGEKPLLRGLRDRSALVDDLIQTIAQEQERWKAIAVVCKTVAACQELAADLSRAGLQGHDVLTSRDAVYTGGLALIPAYLTKGLEFDVVIVADADATTYPVDTLHQRLLYVALTRAAHALHIRWVGRPTLFLDEHHPQLSVTSVIAGVDAVPRCTIAAYVAQRQGWNADACIERLANMEKLHLLRTGTIDPVVLDVLLAPFEPAARESDDNGVAMLDDHTRQRVEAQIDDLVRVPTASVQHALALTELAYGLLRNQLRAANLTIADEGIVPLKEQVCLLLPLFQALETQHLTPGAGRWTTRQSVIQAISLERRGQAEHLFALFQEYGLIEHQTGGKQPLLRVAQQWVHPLLALALGSPTDIWDADMLAQLDRLPVPLTLSLPVAQE